MEPVNLAGQVFWLPLAGKLLGKVARTIAFLDGRSDREHLTYPIAFHFREDPSFS
jgi:hypothetical protein